MSFNLVNLIILTATFYTGYGEWTPRASGLAGLTRHEESYIARALKEQDSCSDESCKDQVVLAIAEVINLRRKLNAAFVGDVVFDALRNPCESLDVSALAQRDCFRNRQNLSFEDGMTLAGFSHQGISRSGFYSLRSGMRLKEVEFVLGEYTELSSRASFGGHSSAMYIWLRGRGIIVVSFSDDELVGKSQSGF